MVRLTLAVLLLSLASFAGAQTYPNKAINLIVPFSTGGPSDAHMRQFAAALGRVFQQPIVIENVPGGGGHIGPARVANTEKAVQYCMQHPQWRLSLQTHKYIGIP